MRDGLLMYGTNDGPFKRIILRSEENKRREIILAAHNVDHSGPRPTYDRIISDNCGILLRDVQEVLSGCENCLRETLPPVLQAVTPIVTHFPHERLIVDTISMAAYSDHNIGFRYVFTFIDPFSKYAWAVPSETRCAAAFGRHSKSIYTQKVNSLIFTLKIEANSSVTMLSVY